MHPQRWKILLLEDDKTDADLIRACLNENLKGECLYRVTDKRDEYIHLLQTFEPDVILSDYDMPSFNGMKALEILREMDSLTPFIFVTGTIGEENAVRSIQAGATDFITKSRLYYLPTAVLRAFREKQEILEKRESEERLKAAFRQVKTAQRLARIGYWNYDFEKKEIQWSKEVFNIWEADANSFHPSIDTVRQTFMEKDTANLFKRDNPIYREQAHLDFEHQILTPMGNIKWVRSHISVLYNARGLPDKLEAAAQDVTRQRRDQHQLQLSNERFEIALKASHEAIWDWDIPADMLYLGQGFEDLLGHSTKVENPGGKFWSARVHVDDLERITKKLKAVYADPKQKNYNEEYRIYKADGSIAYVVDRAYIIRNDKGEATRAVGAMLDFTKTRQLLQDIAYQNQKLRDIAWIQSHVVRAPLSRIMGLITLLEMEDYHIEELKKILGFIQHSARELDLVIREVVKKSSEAQKMPNIAEDLETNASPGIP